MFKSQRLLDIVSLLFSLAVVGIAAAWLWQSGIFSMSLVESQNPIWYLIRSAGITAFVLLTVSVLWGLTLSSRVIKDWSPGPLSMLLHSTISWLGLLFGLGHGLLLMKDSYFEYTLRDVLVPFAGPYRPEAVGVGTLAFWLMLAVAASFPFMKLMGNRAWKILHMGSYLVFVMALLHGLLAGSDAGHPSFRILMGSSVALVLALSAYRVTRLKSKKPAGTPRATRTGAQRQHPLEVRPVEQISRN